MLTQGVDVSHWEGDIDWQEAAEFVPFAYFKCTDGTQMFDPTFLHNKQGCEAYGIPHAPFHYYQPDLDPEHQADFFVIKAGTKFRRYIVDVEERPKDGKPVDSVKLGRHLKEIELRTGTKPAIYTSAGFWNEFVKPKPSWTRSYELLVAHYTIEHSPIIPIGWTSWSIWQFSDYVFFPGCSSAADGDWFNGSLGQAREWFGNYRRVDPPVYSTIRLRSHYDRLHVRNNPDTGSKEIAHLAKGEQVDLEDLGGKDVWVRHSKGWSCVEKDGYRYMEVVK